jgi:competence protein ComEC
LALLIPLAAQASLTARSIDVGQGDCTIFNIDGETVVIDVGPSGAADTVKSELEGKSIALLVLTHPHEDHDGNLEWVVENCKIDRLWMPEYSDDEDDYGDLLRRAVAKGTRIEYPAVGQSICIGDGSITCLSAGNPAKFDDKNLWSIVTRIEYGTTSFLVMGDAEDINEYEMIDDGLDLKADVLRVGHHGSDTSTSEAFVEAVAPSYTVISCGAHNRYGHPDESVLATLEKYGVEMLRTDKNGTISMRSDGHALLYTPG